MINKINFADRVVIFVPADVSADWATEFMDAVSEASLTAQRRIDVDLGAILLLDSYLIGLFVRANKILHQNGGSFYLANPNEYAVQVLKRNALDQVFPIAAAGNTGSEQTTAYKSGISFEKVDTLGILTVTGIIDNPEYVTELRNISAGRFSGLKSVIVDFSKTIFVDSLFIGELVNLHRRMAGLGGSVAFSGLNDIIKELFDRLGFGLLVPLYKDINEAKKQSEKN
ncbi:MAG: hypothetical protein A2268_09955 [Candidatus Raymondbacteria bacterium RifOxyA12_full_50_37]|uniref:STAS domain-containing protein n=1 Tax=Candidatus Raymondbacteria bacterium RIFOXYD12_FULL_49_13 TaxID=1817890 RepID=A0A1F7F411_UNCRA|nr:MAG: hypothetical protein A2350_16235 [Candidatus Raymondbacteria bacterium RifOxyB12_full_50_8]OGJ90955.1 MAG: hypothetical protein A2268_09955 [Candidatus Raymondbacteria bacterium RifOxyA12_full_50_37]OGJ93839.1 MAG: hypothetical protein A2248_06345 [Candidatus Raymondbacteria bacterium RIFOXYA2_FULL_49_16]OGJ97325.1 MAG: hypothetical protein A2487_16485 [Candidatus Raymondbacteria bacterium RifOxyC12_full_50_8]OGJ98294.1 MAG: hypothetical protein A2453_00830 [Candidatus Raymondbacteria b